MAATDVIKFQVGDVVERLADNRPFHHTPYAEDARGMIVWAHGSGDMPPTPMPPHDGEIVIRVAAGVFTTTGYLSEWSLVAPERQTLAERVRHEILRSCHMMTTHLSVTWSSGGCYSSC